jgi:hypothetical protein
MQPAAKKKKKQSAIKQRRWNARRSMLFSRIPSLTGAFLASRQQEAAGVSAN